MFETQKILSLVIFSTRLQRCLGLFINVWLTQRCSCMGRVHPYWLGWVGFSNKIFQFLVYNVVIDSRSRLLANKLVAVEL